MLKFKNLFIYIWILSQCFIAGFINVTSIQLFSQNVSHHTGNLSKLVISIFNSDTNLTITILIVIVCFIIGSIISGLLFHTKDFKLKKIYGILLLSMGFFTYVINMLNSNLMLYYFAFIMGLGNSLFIFFDDTLIRITHFTGYLSDIGFDIGRVIMGHKQDINKIILYILSIISFLIGGYFFFVLNNNQILFISIYYIVISLLYFIIRFFINDKS